MQCYQKVSEALIRSGVAPSPHVKSLLALVVLFCGVCSANASTPQVINNNSIEPKNSLLIAFSKWINESGEQFKPTLKLDRRFTVESCDASFKFERIEYSKNLVRISCEGRRWARVATMQSLDEKISNPRESRKVPIAVESIKRGDRITSRMFEYQYVNPRMAPKNLLNVPLSNIFIASLNIKRGDILTQANLHEEQQAYVAVTTIPSGSPLHKDFFEFTSTTKISDQNILIKDLGGIDFLAANRTIHPGTLLTKKLVRKAKLVNRGDQVIMESRGKGFSIRATRYALEDGYLGDQVRLKSNAGDIETRGTVAGRNFVVAMKKN